MIYFNGDIRKMHLSFLNSPFWRGGEVSKEVINITSRQRKRKEKQKQKILQNVARYFACFFPIIFLVENKMCDLKLEIAS